MADKKCPVCKKNIAAEMKFCPFCMTRFNEITQIPVYKKSRKAAYAVITAVCILLCLGDVGAYFLTSDNKENTGSAAGESKPSATSSDSGATYNTSGVRGALSGNLSQDNFYNSIRDFCSQNNFTAFGIDEYSSLSFVDNGGKITISFVDVSGAEITLETNSDIDFAQIKIKIHDTNENEHIREIGECLGELFFSCDLSDELADKSESCAINSYIFNMTYSTQTSPDYSSEYNIAVQLFL